MSSRPKKPREPSPARSSLRPPAPLRRRGDPLRLYGAIARNIGVRIVSGAHPPAELLGGEIEASERLRVSRTAYREAIRMLAAKGLVESRPKLGTRVSDPSRWHLLDPDVISWLFASDPDERLLDALFELRMIVEPAAAALAAKRRTGAHLASLREALDRMRDDTLAAESGRAADRRFHSVLLEASGNPFLRSLTPGVAAAVHWTTVVKQRNGRLVRDPLPDHERVYEAVATGDADGAVAAMTELIRLALLDMRRGDAKRIIEPVGSVEQRTRTPRAARGTRRRR